jgi:Lanthionine synthetase C-like protein
MADAFPDGAALAGAALEWLLAMARADGTALAWTGRPDDDELDPTLYSGTAGIVLALLEGYRHFGDERFAAAAVRSTRAIAAATDREWELSSLYFGLAGMAFALRAAAGMLGERAADLAAARGLDLVRARFDGQRWADQFELLGGNAGIALAAVAAGDLDLAILAVTPYLAAAEPTPGGVHWEVRAGLHPLRPPGPAVARLLGQQRTLLRYRRGPRLRLRPPCRAGRRPDLRRHPRHRPRRTGHHRCPGCELEQLRTPGHPWPADPADRLGHGQRRHHP